RSWLRWLLFRSHGFGNIVVRNSTLRGFFSLQLWGPAAQNWPQFRSRKLKSGERSVASEDRAAATGHPRLGSATISHCETWRARDCRLRNPIFATVLRREHQAVIAGGHCLIARCCRDGEQVAREAALLIFPLHAAVVSTQNDAVGADRIPAQRV